MTISEGEPKLKTLEEIRPKGCKELLEEFEQKRLSRVGERLRFEGVDNNKVVYNPTVPFVTKEGRFIAGRVEAPDRDPETDPFGSRVEFFTETKNGVWIKAKGVPTFSDLEDPFITWINGEFIFGGVQVFPVSSNGISFRTLFYKGQGIRDLKYFTQGPDGMKDIRLIELKDRKIGVFTRPQGGIFGRGRIGFVKIGSLNKLGKINMYDAPLLKGLFRKNEWGGVNQATQLLDGEIGVLGHIAYSGDGGFHYYAIAFRFNLNTEVASSIEIVATRENFPPGPAKTPKLKDVIFPGGMERNDNGMILYGGLSDCEAGKIELHNML